jgi:branched-chain amino acid transport system permease protein
VLGAFAITPLSELLRSYFGSSISGLHLAIYGAIVIMVMLYFPGGITAALTRLVSGRKKTSR